MKRLIGTFFYHRSAFRVRHPIVRYQPGSRSASEPELEEQSAILCRGRRSKRL